MSLSEKQQQQQQQQHPPSLPQSLSPCSNVRRSCSMLMSDGLGVRTVLIDSTNAMNDLAEKISQSIIEKYTYQTEGIGIASSTSSTTAAAVTNESNDNVNVNINVNECIDNLDFASWDADGWHYTGKQYSRPHLSKQEEEAHRFERVALYVMVLDCINFCFWPVDESGNGNRNGKGGSTAGATVTNLFEYEHLASALKKIAEADDILPQKNIDSAYEQEYEHEHGDGDNEDSNNTNTDTVTKAESSYAFAPQNLIHLNTQKLMDILHLGIPTNEEMEEHTKDLNTNNDNDDDNDATVYSVPNIKERSRLINEMGQSLHTSHCGSATHFISKAHKSADMLVHLILQSFPGFRDTAVHNGRWVALYKRAQILVADLWAALGGDGGMIEQTAVVPIIPVVDHCYFYDMDKITTFADYRVPQLLRHLDVLKYSTELSRQVDNKVELVPFCADELYIRAATVVAVDELVDRVKMKLGEKSKSHDNGGDDANLPLIGLQAENVNAVKMDWYLWNIGEKLDKKQIDRPTS